MDRCRERRKAEPDRRRRVRLPPARRGAGRRRGRRPALVADGAGAACVPLLGARRGAVRGRGATDGL